MCADNCDSPGKRDVDIMGGLTAANFGGVGEPSSDLTIVLS